RGSSGNEHVVDSRAAVPLYSLAQLPAAAQFHFFTGDRKHLLRGRIRQIGILPITMPKPDHPRTIDPAVELTRFGVCRKHSGVLSVARNNRALIGHAEVEVTGSAMRLFPGHCATPYMGSLVHAVYSVQRVDSENRAPSLLGGGRGWGSGSLALPTQPAQIGQEPNVFG